MDIATLIELKAKYEREVLVAQAKVEVIDDIIAVETAKANAEATTQEAFDETEYNATDNVM